MGCMCSIPLTPYAGTPHGDDGAQAIIAMGIAYAGYLFWAMWL